MMLADDNARLVAENTMRATRIAEREQPRPDPPPFVKPNRPEPPTPKVRKKRTAQHNRGRRCEAPTRNKLHALDRCPDCDYQLRGSSVDYRRQVIELPAPQPVEIIAQQVLKRWCPHCHRWQRPTLDLTGQGFGQGRSASALPA